jgi:serine/threonine protein kinase
VFRAQDQLLRRSVILKFDSLDSHRHDRISNDDIRGLVEMQHENLCRFYDVQVIDDVDFHGQKQRIFTWVLEYPEGLNIADFVQENPEYRSKLFIDVLNGLAYLHKRKYIHFNMSHNAVLINIGQDGPQARILSLYLKHQETITAEYLKEIQFSVYTAPELLNYNHDISECSDIWSFGILVYKCVTGKYPFEFGKENLSRQDLLERIFNVDLDSELKHLPEPYRQIVERCLVKNHVHRNVDVDHLLQLLLQEGAIKTATGLIQNTTSNRQSAYQDYRSVRSFKICTLSEFIWIIDKAETSFVALYIEYDTIYYSSIPKADKLTEVYLSFHPRISYKELRSILDSLNSVGGVMALNALQLEAAMASSLNDTISERIIQYQVEGSEFKRSMNAEIGDNLIEMRSPDSAESIPICSLPVHMANEWAGFVLQGLHRKCTYTEGENLLALDTAGISIQLNTRELFSAFFTVPVRRVYSLLFNSEYLKEMTWLSIKSGNDHEERVRIDSELFQEIDYNTAIDFSKEFYLCNSDQQLLFNRPIPYSMLSDDGEFFQFKQMGESFVPRSWLKLVDYNGDMIDYCQSLSLLDIEVDVSIYGEFTIRVNGHVVFQ